jgi:sRNA-binding protein
MKSNHLKTVEMVLVTLPPALQAALDGEPVPLAIGSREVLTKHLVDAGMIQDEAVILAVAALREICSTTKYRQVSMDHAERFNLDGSLAARVSELHRQIAAQQDLAVSLRQHRRSTCPKHEPTAEKPAEAEKPKAPPKVGARNWETLTLRKKAS